MSRRKNVVQPGSKHTKLPIDLIAKVELELFSDVEGRVPQGAWQNLQIELLTGWLAKRAEARAEMEARKRIAEAREELGLKFAEEG